MSSAADKRRTPRVPIHFKVKVETVRGTFNGMGRDISEGGIGVYLKKLPPIGSPVEVLFQLPQADAPIEITGEVMYHHRGGAGVRDDWMGIRFVRMDADSQSQIHSFVKSNFDSSQPGLKAPPPLPDK
jgi:uncharacterized protein (TIGR02266 family)